MPKSPKLGAGGYITVADQIRLYTEQMGAERASEQVKLARLRSGKCICVPSKRKIDNQSRLVHDPSCPKWKEWMKS